MLNTVNLFIALVVAAITYGTPLLFGTLGEVLTEKSGSLNLGVEGMMFMGGVAGLVISLGIIFLTVLLDNKIHTEDDIAKYLDLAVVGVIPEYQGGKKK